MGLDVSHDAWHGAYSAFTRWRNCLAEDAGYPLNMVTALGDGSVVTMQQLRRQRQTKEAHRG